MMKLPIILVLMVKFAFVLAIRDGKCTDIVVSGYNYEQEILIEGVDAPYQMTLDFHTNFLFFSFGGSDGFNKAAYINLDTNEFGIIDGVRGGFANAFDADTGKVLIGATDGIYEFDYETNSGVKTNITDKNVWQIFARDGVYFTIFPEELAFVYKNDELNQVEGVDDQNVMLIGVDAENNMFFYNSSGLFCHVNITGETIYINDNIVIGFTTDIKGDLYYCTPTGVFKIKDIYKIEKLARIVGMYGMAMGIDGSIIYSTNNQIIRLLPLGTECVPELTVL